MIQIGTTLNVESIVNDIEQLSFVDSAHDFHAFEVSSDLPILIGHVIVRDNNNDDDDDDNDRSSSKIDYTQYLQQIKAVCLIHGVEHVTIQLEQLSGIHRLTCPCPVSKH